MTSPATAALAVVAALLVLGSSTAEAKLSNVVTDWVNATQLNVATDGIPNQLAARYYALTGLAMHQAIAQGGAPANALAAFAGHAVLSASFPARQPMWDMLLRKQLMAVPADQRQAANAVAVPLARAMLQQRAADESTSLSDFKPAAPGTKFSYQFVPEQKFALYPQLADTTPLIVPQQQVDAVAYNKDASAGPVFQPAKDDYAQTYELGSKASKTRKQYDTDSAFFWAAGANTSGIAGAWLDIAREVLPQDYSVADSALFFARAGAASYDASIAGWKVKYSTLHWRPITAFAQGAPGVPVAAAAAAAATTDWMPLLRTPPHPEYPSGHQATVGAVLEVLLRTLNNKDSVTFTLTSESAPWLNRSYSSLTAAAQEVGDSRTFGGVHFPSANADGLKLGRIIGGKVFDRIAANKPAAVNMPSTFVSAACSGGATVQQAATGAAAAAGAPAAPGSSSTGVKKLGLTINLGRRMA
ncbi:hypothetical protein OEZ85_007688 [Tetradesmus obliquus]|uniref:Phosphatidic acid phosphatase type 2/haloperoxidase domain-containing protein n=1 Tax=Tetradesmus obliquus TaxID=3088 RepID=A0ABY8TIL5_TETOB|nr:hypothetical protein OEZ85_007688 [Tetradesmus obliquus]